MRAVRILITGDRDWRSTDLAEKIVTCLIARYGLDRVIVHGGAPGVDQSFHVPCQTLGVTVEPHLADWKGLGNIAGPARNRETVQAGADLCVAVHRSLASSKGTRDCVSQALGAGYPSG
jgi:hypothetical protein